MAVTLTTDDLIVPAGELSPSFFPDEDLVDNIAGWLTKATAKAEGTTNIAASLHNDAAEAYVYYLAYSYIANRIATMPNTVSLGSGETVSSFGSDRPEYWKRRADNALAVFEATIVPTPDTKQPRRSSTQRLRPTY